MTPFGRLLRRIGEALIGEREESHEAPERLREMVLLFAMEHPHATRREWAAFAAAHAEEAYRSGWIRGWERSEREPGYMERIVRDSEALADSLDPGWRERLPDEPVGD